MVKKILIGFIGSGRDGGVDKYILELLQNLDLTKYKIDLLTSEMNIKLLSVLKLQKIRLFEVNSAKNPWKQYYDIKKLIIQNGYDVVYFNISTAIPFAGIVAAKQCGVSKRIVHSHSSGFDEEKKFKRILMTGLHKLCKRVISNNATDFVACSQKAGEWLYTETVLKSSKFIVLHNAVNLEKFMFDIEKRNELREKYSVTSKKVLLQVANFTYPKNHHFIIKVLQEIVKKDKKFVLWLVGSGKKEKEIRNLIVELNLQDNVRFIGTVQNVQDYLQAADIFVLPSLFEGLPISALEAQASGLPCILSDKITRETRIMSKCKFVPLDVKKWSEEICKLKIGERDIENLNITDINQKELYDELENVWNKE